MPTYEYQCRKCGRLYEKREGFDAPARQRCPSCRGTAQRVLYAPPIVFKGSGFYVTDSRGAAPSEAGASAESSKPSDSGSKDAEPAKPSKTASKDTEAAAAS